MNKTITVFLVIMFQVLSSLLWMTISIDYFNIWFYGCIIADVAAVATYVTWGES